MNEVTDNTTWENTSQTWLSHQATQANDFLAKKTVSLSEGQHISKTFTSKVGVNPLVTAANPLLSLANKLYATTEYANIHDLHQQLTHEIRAFETQAQQLGCESKMILAARYALCALFDELILNTPWGNETNWGQHKLLLQFQQESSADKQFFSILDHLYSEPAKYINVLELMYLCLNLGFCGQYRYIDNGLQERNTLIDKLYNMIRMQRGEFSHTLSIPAPDYTVSKKKFSLTPKKTFLLMFGLILATAACFHYLAKSDLMPIKQQLIQIAQDKSKSEPSL